MHQSASTTSLGEAFERVVHAIPHEPAFRAIEIVTTSIHPGRTTALLVMVDREGGLDIATCERVAARINVALDAFPDEYTLEVTSAGVDRPLVKPADYDRFSGRNVKVVTTLPIGNAKTHRGELAGLRGTNVILRTGAGGATELPIPIATIKSANLEYDIRADLQRAKREKQSKA
ncbi:MAG TPA: ribosome maturation factor RimP [Candidatus Lustribacter sp.]|nr:ribosome maturation factor RimP [Candidatus Lustribacter sp.]